MCGQPPSAVRASDSSLLPPPPVNVEERRFSAARSI